MTGALLAELMFIGITTVVFWSAPVLARPTVPFGVRIPAGYVDHPVVLAERRRHSRRVLATGAIVAAGVTGIRLSSGWPLPLGLATGVVVVAGIVIGLLSYRTVQRAKRDGDWYAGTRQAVTTDTTLRTDPVRPPWWWLAPAVVLLVVTLVLGIAGYSGLPDTIATHRDFGIDPVRRTPTGIGSAFAAVWGQLAITAAMVLATVAILRSRPELDASRPKASSRKYRIYLHGVARLLFGTAAAANWMLAVVSLQIWEMLPTSTMVMVVAAVPLAATLIGWLVFTVRFGEAGHRLPAAEGDEPPGEGKFVQRDDSRHWHLAGMVYANREDPAILVHRRSGVNWTMNMGHPVTWLMLAAVIGLIALSLTGVIDLPEKN